MKVLQINTVCGKSSTGRIATDIAGLLEQQGHECKIAYGRGDVLDQYKKYAVKIGSDFGVKLHAGLARIFDSSGFHSRLATKKFLKWVDTYNPDVVHLHNLHGYYINVELLFSYLSKKDIPVIWTLHDCWAFTGHCVYYDYCGCQKFKTACYQCPKKKEYPTSLIFDNSKSNYLKKKKLFTSVKNMTIITVSDWLKGEAEKSFLSCYDVRRIYNGIDKNVFFPVESNIKEKFDIKNKFLILGVSDGWSERKGLSYFQKLANDLQDDEALVMVGFKKHELALAPKNIIALQRTDSVQQLVEFYSSADVVLNPSFEETFGLVTAEALSCGTPVIVSNSTASPELVDSTCGRVVEKGDYNGIKNAINEIKELNISSKACLKRSQLFDKEQNYQKYIDLYNEVYSEYGKS